LNYNLNTLHAEIGMKSMVVLNFDIEIWKHISIISPDFLLTCLLCCSFSIASHRREGDNINQEFVTEKFNFERRIRENFREWGFGCERWMKEMREKRQIELI
jgi:hypothetical protein